MPRYRARVEYDGTGYHGFQRQPAVPTIQGELETALASLFPTAPAVTGAGRTDAGVHATGQVIHFDAEDGPPVERLAGLVNARLPVGIRMGRVAEAEAGFHARYSATERTYRYWMTRREPSPFLARYVAVAPSLPAEAASLLEGLAAPLVGEHDFAGLALGAHEGRCTRRTVRSVRVREVCELLVVEVAAAGYLRGMVRLMVGLLLEIAGGRAAPELARRLLVEGAAARRFGPAPAAGLCLAHVQYGNGEPGPGPVEQAEWPPRWAGG